MQLGVITTHCLCCTSKIVDIVIVMSSSLITLCLLWSSFLPRPFKQQTVIITANEAVKTMAITNAAVMLPMSNHGTCAEALDKLEPMSVVVW